MSAPSQIISIFRKSETDLGEMRSHEQHYRSMADNDTQTLHSSSACQTLVVVPFHRKVRANHTSMQMQGQSASIVPGMSVLQNIFSSIYASAFLMLLGALLVMLLIILVAVSIGFYAAIGSYNLSGRALRIGCARVAEIGKLLRRILSTTSLLISGLLMKWRSRTKR